MHATTISMYKTYLKIRILEAVKSNQLYLQIKESIQQGKLQQKYKDYQLKEDEILLYRNKFMFLIFRN
jgi:hypothetical protein